VQYINFILDTEGKTAYSPVPKSISCLCCRSCEGFFIGEKIVQAKITGPAISAVVKRERLFRLLDEKIKRPVVWVSAPAGSGKTVLIASYLDSRRFPYIWYQCDDRDSDLATFFYYMGFAAQREASGSTKPLPLLTPEYHSNIPAFARGYFEQLYSCVPAAKGPQESPRFSRYGFVFVWDNYQDVPLDSPFHEMIATGFGTIPAHVHVMVISRGEPPSAFARLQANEKIGLLSYQNVRFTLQESKELLRRRSPKLDNASMRTIHQYTQGWAAGITLMLESARIAGTDIESAAGSASVKVFHYFAEEIFNGIETEVQNFLLKTAFLPTLSVPLAVKLTGAASAGQILSDLNRDNFFTEKLSGSGQEYQYHPLFRDFLLHRAKKTISMHELAEIQLEAALLLEQSGQIEEAARLYSNAGDTRGLARMIVRHAEALLRQGRNRTVAEWIAGIPAEADHDPWLLFWTGMCSFPFDMPRARKDLEEAFRAFKAVDEISGIYLSWAMIVDTYAYELDEWRHLDHYIRVFKNLRKRYPSFPSKRIDIIASSRMLIALTLRKTNQPRQVEEWLERVNALLQNNPSLDIEMDTAFCMSLYYLWKGEYHKNALLLEKTEAEILYRNPPSFAVIRMKLMKGIHYWVTAEYDAALHTLSEGLDAAHTSGVQVFDSLMWSFKAAAAMARGAMEMAEKSLQNQMTSLLGAEKTLDVFFYHINAAWHGLLAGNPSLAAENLEAVSARVTEIGTPYYRALWNIGMAQTTFQQGRVEEAKANIRSAQRISRSMKSHVMEWYSLLISAYFHFQEGREEEGLLLLRRGLSLGKQYGYVHLEFYQPSVMQLLYAKALEQGVEQQYVKGLVRKLGLAPPESLSPASTGLYLESWPYPIKIYTLGRFEIIKDDVPLVFAGKVQKKPLEMLKAVIAFGGSNVPEDRVIDALWPDADGDLARKSFDMALSRLRRLLGGNTFISRRAGELSIDPRICWVDSLALSSVLTKLQEASGEQAVQLCRQAVRLYKGPFLPADSDLDWAVSLRETLKERLLRAIIAGGRYYEDAGQWDQGAAFYLQGIDVDNLAEELYRRLIICCQKLGNKADAVKTYNRCRSILKSELGIEPSAETEAAYSSIIQGQ